MINNPLFLKDFYKADHRSQYPAGTTFIYSNFTPRMSRIAGVDKVIFFGLQYFIKEYLLDAFNYGFFMMPKKRAIEPYRQLMELSLGDNAIKYDHIVALHNLGYLPLRIRALPEGAKVNLGVPMLTIENTHPDFFWLTNFIETLMSSVLWGPCTSATIAYEYRKILEHYADLTCSDKEHVAYQAHDFSMRGMYGPQAAAMSGAAHLLSFNGTDTIPAIRFLQHYYEGDLEQIGTSVYATEHSVMCAGGQEHEFETYRRLIEDVYPKGFVSIVSDTWDLWRVIDDYLPKLKDKIMARHGKVIIRPDSGNPTDIICGKPGQDKMLPGVIESLWDIFGGVINAKGYKVLDPHIGCIYGEGINLDGCKEILDRLQAKGFASSNINFGIGSYTYQYNTRDTFGFAMKATYAEINGKGIEMFKDPATDDGTKRSAKGLLRVKRNYETECYELLQQQHRCDVSASELDVVFEDGKLLFEHTLADIRKRIMYQK